jgi:hypothetical protein
LAHIGFLLCLLLFLGVSGRRQGFVWLAGWEAELCCLAMKCFIFDGLWGKIKKDVDDENMSLWLERARKQDSKRNL